METTKVISPRAGGYPAHSNKISSTADICNIEIMMKTGESLKIKI